MADAPQILAVDTEFDPQTGQLVPVVSGLARVTANNSGPYTFTGTNSFLIGDDTVALVDPGPAEATHHAALVKAIGGRKLTAILLTHTHRDHSASAAQWKHETGAPLWFSGPHKLSRPPRRFERNALARDCDWDLAPDRTLRDGEEFEVGGVRLTAIATPGHCFNHMAFALTGTDTLLTGDHIMGWNSTLVAVPDGSMAQYLDSLRKVLAMTFRRYVPAHGGPIADGKTYTRALLTHRELRNRQVVEAVRAGITDVAGLLDRIYPTLSLKLRLAAALTLRAHIEYLEERRQLRVQRNFLGGLKLSPV